MAVNDRAAEPNSAGIGAATCHRLWLSIDWADANRRVRNLRFRLYRASREQQWKKVRSLMQLMLRSRANLVLAVRQVTQLNAGKFTPGIDGHVARTASQRGRLILQAHRMTLSQVKPVRRIEIPKASGQTRSLGIPCLLDRIKQMQVKQALEPVWEAVFEARSYGFRPGRSAHDALAYSWVNLLANKKRPWILKADIESAFDQIDHDFLLQTIGPVPGWRWIKKWLKAGYVTTEGKFATPRGTPQGGPISPLMLNIALHGLENELMARYRDRPGGGTAAARLRMARYADDLIVMARSKEELESLIPALNTWLAPRGLRLHPQKSRIAHIEEGVDFLGFTVRQFKGVCLLQPSKEGVQERLARVRQWLKQHPSATPEQVIKTLNPILRGWAEYDRVGAAKKSLQLMAHRIWESVWRWCLKRHPEKGYGWVKKRYFKTVNGRKWTFAAKVGTRLGQPQLIKLINLGDVPIRYHSQLKGTASPDDRNLVGYWQQRRQRRIWNSWETGRRGSLMKAQQGQCPHCKDWLDNGETTHVHHRQAVKDGGADELDNLVTLHQICHQQIHHVVH